MKKVYLHSKNFVLKVILTFLGFTLAASQCLAQYMVFYPEVSIKGKLIGITDTLSKFLIIVNKKDTVYTSAKEEYKFSFNDGILHKTYNIDVQELATGNPKRYIAINEIVAIKPKNGYEIEIHLKKIKHKK